MQDIIEQLKFFSELGVTHLNIGEAEKNPLITSRSPSRSMEQLRAELGDCTRCKLSVARTHIVFGCGNPEADLMFIGEAPGAEEDAQGVPFVGRAGRLLTRIIEAIDLKRDDVYIANIIKCRPPDNRNPQPDEIEACSPFVEHQVELVKPLILVALGKFAAQTLLQTDTAISRLRGRFVSRKGIPVMPTFHPSYLLRVPSAKRLVWEDVQKVRDALKERGSIYYRTGSV